MFHENELNFPADSNSITVAQNMLELSELNIQGNLDESGGDLEGSTDNDIAPFDIDKRYLNWLPIFGVGKRASYEFENGKRAPYEFGIGKRTPYEFGIGKYKIRI